MPDRGQARDQIPDFTSQKTAPAEDAFAEKLRELRAGLEASPDLIPGAPPGNDNVPGLERLRAAIRPRGIGMLAVLGFVTFFLGILLTPLQPNYYIQSLVPLALLMLWLARRTNIWWIKKISRDPA